MTSLSVQGSWLAVVTVGAGVANLALLWTVRRHRNRPGGRWFGILAGLMAAICFTYGVAFAVFEPRWLREALEALFWVLGGWASFAWFAFALTYTGRGRWLRTKSGAAAVAVVAALSILQATNPFHGLFWTAFRLDPVWGAATVAYVRQPGLLVGVAAIGLLIAISLIVLLETIVSYGPLFRSQAIALALTPIFPVVGLVAYVFELGPAPRANLLPLLLVPHVVLDVYALFGGRMFEFDPATRRVGERAAIDDVDTPLVTVDVDGRIITANDAARSLLDAEVRTIAGESLERRLSTSIALDAGEQDVEVLDGEERRHYRVTTSPFHDGGESPLGYTVVLQDVTDIVQRERRLAVLNRVLRHNLRNDLTIVTGHAEMLGERIADPDLTDSADVIVEESRQLLSVAERTRQLDRTIDGVTEPDAPVGLRSVIEGVASDLESTYSEATVAIDAPTDLAVRTDPDVLRLVLENVLDNALAHNDSTDPIVEVRASDDRGAGGSVWIDVADDGPGIPAEEVSALEDGTETALHHGSGLGLWVVRSGVTALGGDLSFSTDGSGTTVTLRIPGAVTDRSAIA